MNLSLSDETNEPCDCLSTALFGQLPLFWSFAAADQLSIHTCDGCPHVHNIQNSLEQTHHLHSEEKLLPFVKNVSFELNSKKKIASLLSSYRPASVFVVAYVICRISKNNSHLCIKLIVQLVFSFGRKSVGMISILKLTKLESNRSKLPLGCLILWQVFNPKSRVSK